MFEPNGGHTRTDPMKSAADWRLSAGCHSEPDGLQSAPFQHNSVNGEDERRAAVTSKRPSRRAADCRRERGYRRSRFSQERYGVAVTTPAPEILSLTIHRAQAAQVTNVKVLPDSSPLPAPKGACTRGSILPAQQSSNKCAPTSFKAMRAHSPGLAVERAIMTWRGLGQRC